ncbi:MAG: tetratricopeptide repeat protein [Acidobacteriota bacterium]
MTEHPPEEVLIRFAGGDAPEARVHVEACAECSAEVGELRGIIEAVERGGMSQTPRLTTPAGELANLAERLQREREEAPSLVREILASPQPWLPGIPATPRFGTVGVVRALLQAADEISMREPQRALSLTELATGIADVLAGYPAGALARIRSHAAREHAFALYYAGRFHEALETAEHAGNHLRGVPGSEYDRARADIMRAIVLRELDRTDEAIPLVRSAADVFREHGDQQRYLSAQTTLAALSLRVGDARRALAISLAVSRESHLEPLSSLAAMTMQNIGVSYAALEQPLLARQSLSEASSQFAALGLTAEKLRADWALARILMQTNMLQEATTSFERLRTSFASLGMPSEAALASLDLVECLLLLDEADAAYDECRSVVAALTQSGLGTTARARTAIAYLREATAERSATPSLIQSVRAHLDPVTPQLDVLSIPPSN